MELVDSVEGGVAFCSLWVPVVEVVERLLISEVKGFNGLTHSPFFIMITTRRLSTFILFVVALHLLVDLKHNLIVGAIGLVLTIGPFLPLSLIIGSSSGRARGHIRIL